MKNNKYYAQKCKINGSVFDSRKEAQRHQVLLLLQKSGQICDLERQKKYILIPTQRDENGKLIERELSYIADFVYKENGKEVVEDVKGYKEGAAYRIFSIKRKLMLSVHGIRVREV
jgi:hypothetical protein